MTNQMNKIFEGIVTGVELNLLGLQILPGGADHMVVCAGEDMEQSQFSRQTSLLDGYLCLALGGLPDKEYPVSLESLAIPAEETAGGKAAVWFAMACRSEDPRRVTMAVYNGFGALGGYEQMERYVAQYLGQSAQAFLDGVKAAKWDEDDAGNSTGPEPGIEVWRKLDLSALRAGLLNACRAEL